VNSPTGWGVLILISGEENLKKEEYNVTSHSDRHCHWESKRGKARDLSVHGFFKKSKFK
jgi:hypothetical protein